ncbi:MAG TPA: hypothetical protein GXZ48_03430 [Acholeplasmataceae bacterium]|jgi:hypothetical protein|nr:hypothetical protein [Acholeplasmataceae bacterium]
MKKDNRNKNNLECASELSTRRHKQSGVNAETRKRQNNENKYSYEFGNDTFTGSDVNRKTMTDVDLERLHSHRDYDYEFGYDSYFPNLDNEGQYERHRNQNNQQSRNRSTNQKK